MKNLFGEGLWLIVVIPFLASLWFLFIAYKKSKSGSEKQLPGGGYDYSDKNVPIYQIGQFWFGVALFVATIAIYLVQLGER